VTVLDIGQGDAILLQGPTGGRALIDTGPDPDRLLGLLDERLPSWDRRVDLVVLTHPHEDHVAGLALLLDRYRIGAIVEPGMVGPGPGDAAYRRRLTELGRETRVVAAGDRLWLDGIALDVEWPLPGRVPLRAPDGGAAINNVSIVLDVKFGARRMLFSGDVEEDIDPQLLAAGIADKHGGQPLDILKVAHHGSGTATTDAFVERFEPQIAVISAGSGNPYGHPSPETVARLTEAGARLFRTDIDGSVDISTNGTDLVASATGGRPVPTRRPTEPPGVGFCPLPAPATSQARQSGRQRRPTYNRTDGNSFPLPGRCDPGERLAQRAPHDPLHRCRRDRRLPVRSHGPPRAGGGQPAGGVGGAAPRPGQGAPNRRSDPETGPRHGGW
jgi:beta-lactamase superfamily II metal-dependent hydrolase